MQLTQKETMLLQELKGQEQICAEKYRQYAEQATNPQLKQMFDAIRQAEQTHSNTLTDMLAGQIPMMSGGERPAIQTPTKADYSQSDWQQDAYYCQDALSTEKHASSLYDTSIFEFTDVQARDALNHIQKEEQQHGKFIYDYMAVNGMYS